MALDAEIDFEEGGYKVAKVKVHAVVTFTAYVLLDENGLVDGGRIESEIADAIQYHAGHLGESEDGDALIATTAGGEVYGVSVDVDLRAFEPTTDYAAVNDAIQGTAAWL